LCYVFEHEARMVESDRAYRQVLSRPFAEIDREISPGRPDLENLVGIEPRHGMTVAA